MRKRRARFPETNAPPPPEPGHIPSLGTALDPAGRVTVPLAAEQELTINSNSATSVVSITGPGGRASLKITVTASGLSIELGSLGVSLQADGALTLEAEHLTFIGRKGVSLETQGDLAMSAEGSLTLTASDQKLVASSGNVDVKANDDVNVQGERILLNS